MLVSPLFPDQRRSAAINDPDRENSRNPTIGTSTHGSSSPKQKSLSPQPSRRKRKETRRKHPNCICTTSIFFSSVTDPTLTNTDEDPPSTAYLASQRRGPRSSDMHGKKARKPQQRVSLSDNDPRETSQSLTSMAFSMRARTSNSTTICHRGRRRTLPSH